MEKEEQKDIKVVKDVHNNQREKEDIHKCYNTQTSKTTLIRPYGKI